MGSARYSLRWNNHQNHLLNAFEGLLQNETLVDVTLVCEEASFKAHKVVLSACSAYFQRIFCETPCKHPVIVLKDLRGWEMQAIVDFMYKGEINVGHEQLPSLMNAAESLQVKGLAQTEQVPMCNIEQTTPQKPESTCSSNTSNNSLQTNAPIARSTPCFPSSPTINSFYSQNSSSHGNPSSLMIPSYEPHVQLPQVPLIPNISFNDPPPTERHCSSPIPRRKQARPRRRSGDCIGPQDLTKGSITLDTEIAENLSIKKPVENNNYCLSISRPQSRARTSPCNISQTNCMQSMRMESDESEMGDSSQNHPMELTTNSSMDQRHLSDLSSRLNSLPPEHHQQPYMHPRSLQGSPPQHQSGHVPPLSGLPLTPPHMFPMDAHLGLFPALDSCRSFLLNDILDPKHDSVQPPNKKKMCRPKGQHSAPRGGPPRSWTNAELTEALQHVWNKKMTTSQASRIFGIPYNSLLMYVRGKYGKSLKLEKLKQECFGDNLGSLDLLSLNQIASGAANNNNNQPNKPMKMPDADLMLGPPGFNPSHYSNNFYPDFAASFPLPVSMMHLLPQADKFRESFQDREISPLSMHMDAYSKEDMNSHRSNSAPIDYNKNERELSSPIGPLDYAKDDYHQNNSIKTDEESAANSPQSLKDEMHLQRQPTQLMVEQNGQD